jgi:hypothetical protein
MALTFKCQSYHSIAKSPKSQAQQSSGAPSVLSHTFVKSVCLLHSNRKVEHLIGSRHKVGRNGHDCVVVKGRGTISGPCLRLVKLFAVFVMWRVEQLQRSKRA